MDFSFGWLGLSVLVAAAPACLIPALWLMVRFVNQQLRRTHVTATSLEAIERLSRTDHIIAQIQGVLTTGHATVQQVLIGRTEYASSEAGKLVTSTGKKLDRSTMNELEPFFVASAFAGDHPALHTLGTTTSTLDAWASKQPFVRTVGDSRIYEQAGRLVAYLQAPVEVALVASNEIWDHGHVRKLGARDRTILHTFAVTAANQGHHTVVLGYKLLPKTADAETLTGKDVAEGFTLLGAISLNDPLRATTPAAVRAAEHAGIATTLVSAYPTIALAIATKAGFTNHFKVTAPGRQRRTPTTLLTNRDFKHTVDAIRMGRQAMMNVFLAIRIALVAASGKLMLAIVGIVLYSLYRVAPPLNVPQLLLIELALILPLATLAYDHSHHQLMRQPPRKLNTPFAAPRSFLGLIGFGITAASISLAGYAFFFWQHNLSPRFLDPNLPMQHQAATLACLTLIMCIYAHLLFERSNHHKTFFTEYLSKNRQLLTAFGISLTGFALITHSSLQSSLHLASLSTSDWAVAVFGGGLYSCFRLVQRYTRLHTREALLKLHLTDN
jgi:magnesium-transporting ATPase (P-type)